MVEGMMDFLDGGVTKAFDESTNNDTSKSDRSTIIIQFGCIFSLQAMWLDDVEILW
jgi:hypothetical protein